MRLLLKQLSVLSKCNVMCVFISEKFFDFKYINKYTPKIVAKRY